MTKKDWQIVLAPVFFFFFFFFFNNALGTINRRTEAEIREKTYRGQIVEIYRDKDNHLSYSFKFTFENKTFDIDAESWEEAWTWASVGDSIIKQTDTLMITIKKPNGQSKEFYRSRTKFALESDCITGFMVKILPK